ncbi:MAG: molybdopterin-guanine dinucleotide biosynthesis protein A [Kiloniellaceae bacterium]
MAGDATATEDMTMRALGKAAIVMVILIWAGAAACAAARDRHAGYYYPEPGSREVYEARSETLPEADRGLRIRFVTGITNQLMNRPFAPTTAIFAKGAEGEKLIIVALEDGRIDTIYRARAIFANMTAAARTLPAFRQRGVQDWYTFFDPAKMLGFKLITITNGRDFAHQVTIE